MNTSHDTDLDPADLPDSWAHSVTGSLERSSRRAWIVAALLGTIALLEAIALVFLLPLKTVEPYTLLVDRQTGNVEELAPLDEQTVAPDTALTRSFLVQYVNAREGFDLDALQDNYRKITLQTSGAERQRYIDLMQGGNPLSPLSFMSRDGIIRTDIRSISSLAANRSMVRFTTTQTDQTGRARPPEYWAAVIDYEFSTAEMSEADRFVNPLGFQVTRYRRSAETLPEVEAVRDQSLPNTAAAEVSE
ncbi:VirB8/TrbF family protein [Pontixanthobacter aestiaquae]|uniref:virB8 family protein n=1 Tax=Pontixanthobacter aestiaquae TaxID=1509367 RepID=UPI0025B39057|nr:VirB8/TrbF family protein [Pontixanthobacter aestiaquae]MDN3644625.1 VirB8/TrbF family protein [Pontixanthobacter aestiaquae]